VQTVGTHEGQVPGKSCQPQDRLSLAPTEQSPDLNPLDFFLGVAEKEVCDKRPKSLNQLKLNVEEFALRGTQQETLFNVAEFCLQEAGVIFNIF